MIESQVSIKLESFDVPGIVRERKCANNPPLMAPTTPIKWQAPYIEPRQFQLSEIPGETLLEMCEDFRTEVFKRAGKSEYLRFNTSVEV